MQRRHWNSAVRTISNFPSLSAIKSQRRCPGSCYHGRQTAESAGGKQQEAYLPLRPSSAILSNNLRVANFHFLMKKKSIALESSRYSSVGIATSRTAGVRFPEVARYFFFMSNIKTGSVTHPPSYPMGTAGSFLGGLSGQSVKLTTHLNLVPRSRTLQLCIHSSCVLMS
jgi:hypothetical protein